MAIETQNSDYNLYASAATIYNKTAAADHDLSLEIRFGDGTKNLNAGVGTLTITVTNDGGVEGGDSQVVYKGTQTRTVIRTGKLRVTNGKALSVTAQSSNSNDTDVDVMVTPRWESKADSHGAAVSNLLFESSVVSYETSELGTSLYIDGGPNQSGCFNRATIVVYDASNGNVPSFRQVVLSAPDSDDTYLAVSSAFDFTPVEGDLVRVLLNPREMALLPIYDPAKTAAQAGDEMALTASARTTLVAALEAEIADDATGEAVKQAIVAKLIENLPELDDLSLAAIAEACATAILATPANKLVTDASGAVATDAVSRTASKATASEIRDAVGMATANLDTQLGAKATSVELAAVQTHGDSTWVTAVGFAEPGDAMTLSGISDANLGKLEDILDGTGAEATFSQLNIIANDADGALRITNAAGNAIYASTDVGSHAVIQATHNSAVAGDAIKLTAWGGSGINGTLSSSATASIWAALTSAMSTAGSIGKKLADWVLGSDNMVKVSADAHTSGQTIKAVTDAVTTDAASREASKAAGFATPTDIFNLQTHGDETWATANVSGVATAEALAAAVTKIDTIDDIVDAILEDTGTTLPAAISGTPTGVWQLAGAIDGKTPKQAMQYMAAMLAGLVSGAGTASETFVGLDGVTERVKFTTDADGNRTVVEYDPE